MIDRKINVEKLTDDQLKQAEDQISKKINSNIDSLVNKWNPTFHAVGEKCLVKIVIARDGGDMWPEQVKVLNFDKIEDKKLINQIEQDLMATITDCNKFLSRYSLICDMTVVTESI